MPNNCRSSHTVTRGFVLCIGLCATTGLLGAAEVGSVLERADQLRQTGHYAEARELYGTASESSSAAAAIGVARCFLHQGEYQQADAELVRALASNNTSAALHAVRAELAWQQGRHDQVRHHTERALAAEPKHLAARWWQAELHRAEGDLQKAQDGYAWFIDYYNQTDAVTSAEDLRWIALAAAQHARWTRNHTQFHLLVNQLYPEALKRQPHFWQAHLEAARLFLEKYNHADAQAELDDGLAINPNAAELYVERARIALQDFQLDRADAALQQALRINPRSTAALQLVADNWLVRQQYAPAVEALQKAERIDPRDPQTLGRLAGVHMAMDGWNHDSDDGPAARWIRQVEAENPRCGEFYLVLASTLDLLRKYPPAETYYQLALQRMPQLTEVRGRLGLMAMRLGDEPRAAKLLKESFEIDPFNVRVKNSLEVLDVLSDYAVLETEHFVIRFDRGASGLFAECAAEYLEDEVYPEIVKALQYEPKEKTLFEFFSASRSATGQNWFSARMVGLPFVGVVAACGGKIVGMVSPTEVGQPFCWADTLKHEFVHVVNLQQTQFYIPHWYTEGLAVWHENRPRPPDWQLLLAKRLREGTLFDLDTIQLGFVRPSDHNDWTLAYCQAELYVEVLIALYGETAPQQLLAAYAAPMTTEQALEHCFQTTQPEFEQRYQQHLKEVAQSAVLPSGERLQELEQSQKEAERQAQNGDDQALVAFYRRTAQQFPLDARWPKRLAAHCLASGDAANLQAALEQLHVLEPTSTVVCKKLSQLARDRGDLDAATRWAKEAVWIDCYDGQALAMLGETWQSRGDHRQAARWLERSLRVDSNSNRVRLLLASSQMALGDHQAARKLLDQVLAAEPDHQAALDMLRRLPDNTDNRAVD